MTIKVKPLRMLRRLRKGKKSATSSSNGNDKKQQEGLGVMKRISTRLTLHQESLNEDDFHMITDSETELYSSCIDDDSGKSNHHSSSASSASSGFGWFSRLQHKHHSEPEPALFEIRYNDDVSFAEQLEQVAVNANNAGTHSPAAPVALALYNFVELASRHEIYALRDLLSNQDITFKRVTLVDSTTANNIRRWRYKKDNVTHHTRNLCQDRNIDLVFESSCLVHMDDIVVQSRAPNAKTNAVCGVLDELEKDNEMTTVEVVGHMQGSDAAEQIFKAIISLVSQEDRHWKSVKLIIALGQVESPMEFQQWMYILQMYKQLLAQVSLQYGVPISVEPLTAASHSSSKQ